MKELSDTNKRIVLLVADAMPLGLTPYQLRQKFPEMSPQALYIHLKTLLKKGILTKHKEGILTYYRIAPEGINTISRLVVHQPEKVFTPRQPEPAAQPAPLLTARAHKFGIAYPLKDALSPSAPTQLLTLAGIQASPVALRNSQQAYFSTGSITARLTNRALLLYTADLYTDNHTPTIEIESAVKAQFDAAALNLEARLQRIAPFKLRRIDKDTLEAHITTQHWAEERHPAAEASKESPIIMARSQQDGKARLGIDMSKGFRELETYHSRTADIDKDVIDREFNALLDGRITLFDISAHSSAIADIDSRLSDTDSRLLDTGTKLNTLAEGSKDFALNLQAHASAIKSLSSYSAELIAVIGRINASMDVRDQQAARQAAEPKRPGMLTRLKRWLP